MTLSAPAVEGIRVGGVQRQLLTEKEVQEAYATVDGALHILQLRLAVPLLVLQPT